MRRIVDLEIGLAKLKDRVGVLEEGLAKCAKLGERVAQNQKKIAGVLVALTKEMEPAPDVPDVPVCPVERPDLARRSDD